MSQVSPFDGTKKRSALIPYLALSLDHLGESVVELGSEGLGERLGGVVGGRQDIFLLDIPVHISSNKGAGGKGHDAQQDDCLQHFELGLDGTLQTGKEYNSSNESP